MAANANLELIRTHLFHGSVDYTKSQPDLFLPHRFQLIAPSQIDHFIEELRDSLVEDEILLYVHFPFCFSECRFCNSFPHHVDRKLQRQYLESLLAEISLFEQTGLFSGKRAKCVYFGGGTPTSFANDDLRRVLDALAAAIDVPAECSKTCEAHPSTLAGDRRVRELAAIGINRVSIGCQTFDPEVLALCNRSHSETTIREVIDSGREAGVAMNIDMMTGLPGQSLESVLRDLEILESIRPAAIEYIRHEIVNPLVIALYRERPELVVGDDTLFEMVLRSQVWMESHGYQQNGRFRSGDQWEYRYHWLKETPIIAFGSRARSYTKTICYDKHEELSTYFLATQRGIPPAIRYIALSKTEQMYRSLLLNVQIASGLDSRTFQRRFGEDPRRVFAELIRTLEGYGCLDADENSIHLTRAGAYFVEDVCDFILDAALREESDGLRRKPHSEGNTSSRLT